MTQDQVAHQTGWSLSKVVRIERGVTKISIRDLRRLLQLYEVAEPQEIGRLVNWAQRSRATGWWMEYKDVFRRGHEGIIALEAEARTMYVYEAVVVVGLLQTAAYAREVLASVLWAREIDSKDRRVALRQRRQREIFHRSPPPDMVFLLDEPVIRRIAGNHQVMADQLDHLVTKARHPHVAIQIVPFSAGLHVGLDGSFVLIDLGRDDWLAYNDSRTGGGVIDSPTEVTAYRKLFDQLRTISLSAEDSLTMLKDTAAQLRTYIAEPMP